MRRRPARSISPRSRRPRGLHLRRARQGRHHASGVPQHRADGRAALRRAARSQAQGQAAAADRHRQRRHDARLLQGAEDAGRSARRPRRDRRMGPAHLRLDGPRARLQGGVPGDARRQRRVLRAVPGEREALVQVQPGARAVRQPRHHPSAGRPRQAAERSGRRLLPRREGDRRRARRVRRQGGGDRLGADELHLRRAPRAHPGAGQEIRRRLHGADQRARREVHLPHLVRDDLDRDGQPVRLSAVEPARRERRGVHPRQGAGALGERVRLRRHREGQQLLPAHRLPAALRVPRLHAARGQARFHRRAAAEGDAKPPAPRTSAACRRTSAR